MRINNLVSRMGAALLLVSIWSCGTEYLDARSHKSKSPVEEASEEWVPENPESDSQNGEEKFIIEYNPRKGVYCYQNWETVRLSCVYIKE